MKLKISKILTSVPQFISLKKTKDLPAKIRYNLNKTGRNIDQEIIEVNKAISEKLEQLCDRDEEGKPLKEENGNYKLSEENLKKFSEEIKELHNQEVEIYCTPISLSQNPAFGDNTEISDEVFEALDWLFVD